MQILHLTPLTTAAMIPEAEDWKVGRQLVAPVCHRSSCVSDFEDEKKSLVEF